MTDPQIKPLCEWTKEEYNISVKNLLADKTCANCSYVLVCSAQHDFTTCYDHIEMSPESRQMLVDAGFLVG